MSWNTLTAERRKHLETILTTRQLRILQNRLDGHTWRTIADALSIDEATCRGHYRRALARIEHARKDNP